MQFEVMHNAHRVPAHAISEVGSIKLDQPAPQIARKQANRSSGSPYFSLSDSSHPDDDALFLSWAVETQVFVC